ncbi:FecR domain-containing protein [Chitinophaga oryzae]|uniref:FecR domain-containing protein n=1 Tax=Chitinophaga oryzae TaxID=2725414 RepID=A0AAE7D7X1_9BACT|nr:FecR domain-containing protein [Chitinophaga oryzae]QJB32807.1 FecR domain-containing protein [Chitinophaga oryzae]
MTENQPSPEWEKLAAKLEQPRQEGPLSPEEEAYFDIRDAAEGWQEIASLDTTAAWQEVAARIEHTQRKRYSINWFRVAAAAVVTGLIAGGAVFLLKPPRHKPTTSVVAHAAGNNQQIQLITGSGATVVLDSVTQLKEADGTRITAGKAGVAYQAARTGGAPVFNTLVVPRGQTYKVTLADGTRVWLNADSRLRFPVAFSGDAREVELEGEACFETAPMAAKPFLVKVRDMNVTVLGTEFNINAYTNNTLTTLVSGKVKVDAGPLVKELSPGQQAVCRQGNMTVASVDAEQFTAWKEGLLVFDNESLEDIMIRLGREYDYTVNFENKSLQQLRIGGNIEKSPSVAQVLTLIEQLTDVHFVIDQPKRTIMVKQGK